MAVDSWFICPVIELALELIRVIFSQLTMLCTGVFKSCRMDRIYELNALKWQPETQNFL